MHRQERPLKRAALVALLLASPALAEPKAATHVLEVGAVRVDVGHVTATSEKASDRDGFVSRPEGGRRDEVVLHGGAGLVRDVGPIVGEGLARDCARKIDASLAFVGADGNEVARMSFAWAVVTEVGLPAMEAGSTAPAEMTLKLEPQFPRRVFQRGAVPKPAAGPLFQRAGFKLAIDGLDLALKAPKQLGALTITQAATGSPVTCGAAAVSDLSFVVADADLAPIAAWAGAKNGTVDYLAADGSTLLRVKLTGLRKKSQAAAEKGATRVVASVDSALLTRK